MLKNFLDKKENILGFEPSKNVADQAKSNGVPTVNEFFNTKNEKVSIDCMKVTLQKMKREVFPVTSLVFATKFAHSAIKSICSIDTVLFYN